MLTASGPERKIRAYIELIRPKQWYKNLLLIVALVFSRNLSNYVLLSRVALGFAIFCLLSGSMYALNDIWDREKDLNHPRKSRRPIPSGRISLRSAEAYAATLFAVGLIGAATLGLQFFLLSLAYLVVTTSYTLALKRLVIIDALGLGAGFVIRAYSGAVAIDVRVSPWLTICVFLLALVLAFGKRRHELALLGEAAGLHRESLDSYSVHLAEDLTLTSAATLIMAYSMYTFLATSEWMMLTIPFVIFGLFRFMFLTHGTKEGGEADILFSDLPSVANIVMWIMMSAIILYFAPASASSIGR